MNFKRCGQLIDRKSNRCQYNALSKLLNMLMALPSLRGEARVAG